MSQTSSIEKVLIIGAGQMGNGIGHVSALAGKQVILADLNDQAVANAISTTERNLQRQVKSGKLSESDAQTALSRVRAGTISEASSADLIVEAVTEDFDVKVKIYNAVRDHLKADAILATNTSSIPITKLAAASGVAERFVGLHFFNPVPVMKLVEIIRGLQTSEETFQRAVLLGKELGKTPISSRDTPAFIANRILLPMINEAIFALYEGVGSVQDIDTAMKLGMRHPMGPLQLADYIGLDTCLAVLDVLLETTGDSKFRAATLLRTYVQAGWLGVKTQRGFYDYSSDEPVPTI